MDTARNAPAEILARATARLDELRAFRGPPNEFWPAYLEALAALVTPANGAGAATPADAAALVVPGEPAANAAATTENNSSGGDTAPTPLPAITRWRTAWEWTARPLGEDRLTAFRGALRFTAETCMRSGGFSLEPLSGPERSLGGAGWLAAVRLEMSGEGSAIVVLLLPAWERVVAEECGRRVRLAADAPHVYGLHRHLEVAQREVETFASALDLVSLLDGEKNFAAAAMALCNELASRHQCQRVSLGWRRGPYVRLVAVSHMEKFERRMAVVRQLEAAMEEAADQDVEIVLPATADSATIVRDHEIFAGDHKPGSICTVPLRISGKPVGAISAERLETIFTEHELRHLRLAAEHASRRLDALDRAQAWFGKRLARDARERLRKLLGVEHTLAKAGAIVGAVVLLWSLVWPMRYRVNAGFSLRGSETAVLSAPFEGYLGESLVEKGDAVAEGAVLAKLDQTELALQISAAQADETRFLREVQKARSERALPEMQIAQARADQAKSRLEILKLHLAQSEVRAPFAGVIVDGDLRERIGAPLKQGDALFRLARLDRMYAEVLVKEADVRDIVAGAHGEIAFASMPARKFPVTIERVEPLAQTRPEGNVFLVRCTLPAEAQAWWRPGMSGAARLDVGRRTPLWIATHETLDYLRLRWW